MQPKFAYFGTPTFSTLVLEELEAAGFTPTLIVTAPDRPVGRGLVVTAPPVKEWALAHNVPVIQPENFKTVPAELSGDFDLFIVAAYGKILPQSILSIPKKGALNVHPSLLPRYRGTSPVESQILADEKNVGVSVIEMDETMDHGPIASQQNIEIPGWPVSRNHANEILWREGGRLLAEAIPRYVAGEVTPVPQDHTQATTTKKISKQDGEIKLDAPARENYLKYLAYEGWPGTYFFSAEGGSASGGDKGKRIKITKARYDSDAFVIERVVPEGHPETDYIPGARAPK